MTTYNPVSVNLNATKPSSGAESCTDRQWASVHTVRPKSLQKLRDSIRSKTRRCNGHSMQKIIERINAGPIGTLPSLDCLA